MKNLGALLLALLVGAAGLSACGPDPASELDTLVPPTSTSASAAAATPEPVDPVDEGKAFADADWDGWTGVYGEVRPATPEDVAELRSRVADRNATSWTLHEAETDVEIAYTPEHVRASWGYLDVHVDPRGGLLEAAVTACLDDGCTEIDPGDEEVPVEEALVSRKYPPAAVLLELQLESDDEIEEVLDEGHLGIVTVDSPIGPWDCLAHGNRPGDLQNLVGTDAVADTDGGSGDAFVSWCVDERGMLSPAGLPAHYDAWTPGVDGDATTLVPAEESTDVLVDPTGAYDDALWAAWEGVYRDVRPVTDADVAGLRARVVARNATSWTGELEALGVTLSVSPDHVRADAGYAQWHFEPGTRPLRSPYVLCVQGACVRVGSDADAGGSPHLFNNDLDSTTFMLQLVLAAQAGGVEPHGPTVLAAVDSPVGPLDCLVSGDSTGDLLALEGQAVARLDATRAGENQVIPVCVDQRGLVTTLVWSDFSPPSLYSSWSEGVSDDYDTLPHRVRDYND